MEVVKVVAVWVVVVVVVDVVVVVVVVVFVVLVVDVVVVLVVDVVVVLVVDVVVVVVEVVVKSAHSNHPDLLTVVFSELHTILVSAKPYTPASLVPQNLQDKYSK